MNLDELLARHEISDVIKRLARATDRLDEEMMVSCYHPDGYDDHNVFRGPPTDFAAWVREALGGFEATHHFVGDPYIVVRGEGAQAETYCEAHHVGQDSDMVMGLRYLDRFEKRDGTWLIAKRVCAFDWRYTVPFDPARQWRFGADFTVGRRDRSDISYTEI